MDYRKFKELESKIHAHLSALSEDNGKIYDHCCKYSVDFSEGEICARIGDIVITVSIVEYIKVITEEVNQR